MISVTLGSSSSRCRGPCRELVLDVTDEPLPFRRRTAEPALRRSPFEFVRASLRSCSSAEESVIRVPSRSNRRRRAGLEPAGSASTRRGRRGASGASELIDGHRTGCRDGDAVPWHGPRCGDQRRVSIRQGLTSVGCGAPAALLRLKPFWEIHLIPLPFGGSCRVGCGLRIRIRSVPPASGGPWKPRPCQCSAGR